jgi:signal transduction histidine kinase/ligand-binding sensor domain-containing protein
MTGKINGNPLRSWNTALLCVVFLFLFNFSIPSFSQLRFKHLTINDQLSSNYVNSIFKDHNGFVWIATESGLNRFDGYEVVRFFKNPNDTTGISGNNIFSILSDRQNRIWFGTNHGISVYNSETNKFIQLDRKQSLYDSFYARDIDSYSNRGMVVTSPSALFLYDQANFSRRILIDFDRFDRDYDGETFFQSCIVSNNKLLAATQHNIFMLDVDKPQHVEIIPHRVGVVRRMRALSNTELMIAGDYGIFIFDINRKLIKPYQIAGISPQFFKQEFWDFYFEGNKKLWLASTIGGLICVDLNNSKIEVHKYDKFNEFSLSNNSVRALLVENDGVIWIGTQHGGVNYALLENPKKFKTHSIPDNPILGNSNIYAALLEDSKGNMWVGTDGGGMMVYDSKLQSFTHYFVGAKGSEFMTTNSVLAIREDGNRNVWVGGYRSQLASYNLDSKKWTNHKLECEHELCNGIHNFRFIFKDSKGRMWFATNHHGVFMYDGVRFQSFTRSNSGLIDNYVISISERTPNEIWIGTYNGACILNPDNKSEKIHFKHDAHNSNSLSNDWVYSFLLDRKGRFWLGTSEGLNLYNPDNKSFTSYGFRQGFASEVFFGILEDDDDYLWLSTSGGLIRYNHDLQNVFNYTKNDGLPTNEFHHASCFVSKTGEFFFGSNDGLVHFKPSDIQLDSILPNTVISGVQVFFEDIDMKEYRSEKHPNSLVFNHWQSTISIRYAGVNFLSNRDNVYSYKLKGYQDKWIEVGNRREVIFTNLNPGHYTFLVRSKNKDGVEGEHIAELNFIIQSPWWKTTWFRIVVLILFFLFGFLFFQYRIRIVQKQERRIKKLLDERTSELNSKNRELVLKTNQLDDMNALLIVQQKRLEEQTNELSANNERLNELNKTKDRFFSVVAHDLKNPLNSILGLSSVLADNEYDMDEAYRSKVVRLINKSTQDIYNLLENLLLWSSSQLDRVEALKSNFDLLGRIAKAVELLEMYSSSKDIVINVFSKMKTMDVYADMNMIDTILRNLITNAIKFSHSGGRIEIVCWVEKGQAVCSVRDYGVGMSQSQLDSLLKLENTQSTRGTNGEKGTGLGMIISMEFIEKNDGRIWAESQQGVGTTIYFSLPLA